MEQSVKGATHCDHPELH